MNSTVVYPKTMGFLEVVVTPGLWGAENREQITTLVERYLYGGFYVESLDLTEIWDDQPRWRVIVRFRAHSIDGANDQIARLNSGGMSAVIAATYERND